MSLFSNLFSSTPSSDKPAFPWISLDDLGTLNDLADQSLQKPVFIFKHSTRCSISRFAIKQFEYDAQAQSEFYSFYYLDLITFRVVSNAIAEQFQVMHQSPQLILILKGKVVYVASHSDIDFEKAVANLV